MKRVSIVSWALSALAVCAFLGAPMVQAAAPAAPADGTKLTYFPAKTVVFNHSTHKTADCKACHHKWDGAGAIKKCATAGCHDMLDKKDTTEKSLYKTIHGQGTDKVASCVGCHKKQVEKDASKKKDLTGCSASKCHP